MICKNPGVKVSAKNIWWPHRTLLRECIHLFSRTSKLSFIYICMRNTEWGHDIRKMSQRDQRALSILQTLRELGAPGHIRGSSRSPTAITFRERETEKKKQRLQISTSKILLSVLQLYGCLRPHPSRDWINQPFTDSCRDPLCRLKHKQNKTQTIILIIDYFSIWQFFTRASTWSLESYWAHWLLWCCRADYVLGGGGGGGGVFFFFF